MDKRSRLLNDLRLLGSKSYKKTEDTHAATNDSDDGLEGDEILAAPASPLCPSSAASIFAESDNSESEDELEQHLPLLLPEELANLGRDALKVGQHETAARYLLMAQLRWSEDLRRRLALEPSIEVGKEASFFLWSTARYLEAALHKRDFQSEGALQEIYSTVSDASLSTHSAEWA